MEMDKPLTLYWIIGLWSPRQFVADLAQRKDKLLATKPVSPLISLLLVSATISAVVILKAKLYPPNITITPSSILCRFNTGARLMT